MLGRTSIQGGNSVDVRGVDEHPTIVSPGKKTQPDITDSPAHLVHGGDGGPQDALALRNGEPTSGECRAAGRAPSPAALLILSMGLSNRTAMKRLTAQGPNTFLGVFSPKNEESRNPPQKPQ